MQIRRMFQRGSPWAASTLSARMHATATPTQSATSKPPRANGLSSARCSHCRRPTLTRRREPLHNRTPLSIARWRGRPPAPPKHRLAPRLRRDGKWSGCRRKVVAPRSTAPRTVRLRLPPSALRLRPPPFGLGAACPPSPWSGGCAPRSLARRSAAAPGGGGAGSRVFPPPPRTHTTQMQKNTGGSAPRTPRLLVPPDGQSSENCRCWLHDASRTRPNSNVELALSGRSSLKGCNK